MSDLIKCRVTMRPDDWMYVTQQDYDELEELGILIIGPTQREIAEQVAKEYEAAAAAKPITTKEKPPWP